MRDDGDDRVAQTDPTNSSAAEGAAEPATVATSSFRLHLGPSNPAASQTGVPPPGERRGCCRQRGFGTAAEHAAVATATGMLIPGTS